MKKTTIIKICAFFIVIFVSILINFNSVYAYFISKLYITYEDTMGDIDFEVISGDIGIEKSGIYKCDVIYSSNTNTNIIEVDNHSNNHSVTNAEVVRYDDISKNYSNRIKEEKVYFQDYEIKNTGSCDTLFRINIAPYWINEEGKDWTGDISFIKYSIQSLSNGYENINNNCDYKSDNNDCINDDFIDISHEGVENNTSIKITNENEVDKLSSNDEEGNCIEDFYYSNFDKYLYLKRLFKSGESIKLRVYFSLNEINNELLRVYDGKEPRVNLNAEIVQCTKDAYKSVWNCDNEVSNFLDGLCDF